MPQKRYRPKPAKVIPGAAEAAAARAAIAASRVATIDVRALTGQADISPGLWVRIASGLYAGELAVVEEVINGVIPAATVRTEAGGRRRVRTIDLVRAPRPEPSASGQSAPEPSAPKAEEPPPA